MILQHCYLYCIGSVDVTQLLALPQHYHGVFIGIINFCVIELDSAEPALLVVRNHKAHLLLMAIGSRDHTAENKQKQFTDVMNFSVHVVAPIQFPCGDL